MNKETLPPPSPEIQHLPTLLRRVQAGEIRVPAFQREYVWSEKQIIELLESVYNGYPIGSLLFWQPSLSEVAIKTDTEFPIPHAHNKEPATYIIDGQQRLATLYNCFHGSHPEAVGKFNVTFNLRERTFQHFRAGDTPTGRLHLSTLFSPKAFLQAQQSLAKEVDSELLLDRSIALHATFQEYMIPTVTIKGREISDVVKIFERINNTGVRLSAVDFMRAVTWSEQFDLTEQTSRLREAAEGRGFVIPPETLVKLIAISMGRDPTPDSMLKLRETNAAQLHSAVKTTEEALHHSITLLQKEMKVYSYEYVPYEAQLLVVAKLLLATHLKPSASVISTIKRWFLSVSLTEGLQGKADSVISNLVKSVDSLVGGDSRAFDARIDIEPEDLISRKFIVRRALSSALAMLFAQSEACSLITGKIIPPEDYMAEFSANHYVPAAGNSMLARAKGPAYENARIFPNIILAASEEQTRYRQAPARIHIVAAKKKFGKNAKDVFESQLISEACLDYFINEEYQNFLEERSKYIIESFERLLPV